MEYLTSNSCNGHGYYTRNNQNNAQYMASNESYGSYSGSQVSASNSGSYSVSQVQDSNSASYSWAQSNTSASYSQNYSYSR